MGPGQQAEAHLDAEPRGDHQGGVRRILQVRPPVQLSSAGSWHCLPLSCHHAALGHWQLASDPFCLAAHH